VKFEEQAEALATKIAAIVIDDGSPPSPPPRGLQKHIMTNPSTHVLGLRLSFQP